MWLERIIIRKAEKKLLPYRTRAEEVKQEWHTEYQTYLPQIAALYTKTTHWHGTGRYHYHKGQGNDNVSFNKVVDILDSVMQTNGLQPHQDPWIDSGSKTVSLATVRMHGRIFARVHMHVQNAPLYELGDVRYWSRLYFLLLFIWLCSSPRLHAAFFKKLLRPDSLRSIQNRVGTIRKPHNKIKFSTIEFIQGKALSSDIETNYPILIGVAADASKLIETIPLTHKVEQRSLEPITLAKFTHLEVPQQNVAETEAILAQHNIALPVIPIEFGDLYLANVPLKKLAFS